MVADNLTQARGPLNMSIDAHIDIPWVMSKEGAFDLNTNNAGEKSKTDFMRMHIGGLNGAFFALYLSDNMQDTKGKEWCRKELGHQISRIKTQTGCELVGTRHEARMAALSGLTPIFLGLEGGRLIGEDLNFLNELRGSNVRYLTVTHNKNTSWADSATDTPKVHGLGRFGMKVVKKCNELGIYLDVSHASDATARAIVWVSDKPVIASHSGCKKIKDHERNLTDELIKDIARTGGVVCIPFVKKFIGEHYFNVSRHIDHAVQLVGPNHVGIGSDLDGADLCNGVNSVADWKRVVMEELSSMGYGDELIARIAGENILRLMDDKE